MNKLHLAVNFICSTSPCSACLAGSSCMGIVSEIKDFDNAPSLYKHTASGNPKLRLGSVCPFCIIFRPASAVEKSVERAKDIVCKKYCKGELQCVKLM